MRAVNSSGGEVAQCAAESSANAAAVAPLRQEVHVAASTRRVHVSDSAAQKNALVRALERIKASLATPLSPQSTTSNLRTALLLGALTTYVVLFPLQLAFSNHEIASARPFDKCLELLLLADFLLMFNTAFVDTHGKLVTSRSEIAKQYLRTWFVADLLSSLPLHIALDTPPRLWPTAREIDEFELVPRLIRLLHVLSIARSAWIGRASRPDKGVWSWLVYSRYSHLFRIAWLVLFVVLIAHYVACCWRLLGGGDIGGTRSFEETSSTASMDSLVHAYACSFYDALQLLQGQGVDTTTVAQSVFASFAVLLGSVMLAIVFGHVAMLVANFNANSTNYQRKMESVFAITSKMQLPAPLRERIHQYYDHLCREYESLDGEIERFAKSLSHTLELEVVLCKYMDLITGVPFWADCSPDFQKQLMLNLRVRVYLPDDFVMRRGEVGDEFYMISRGSVELATGPDSFERAIGVATRSKALFRDSLHTQSSFKSAHSLVGASVGDATSSSGTAIRVYSTLQRGQAFGEMALLMNYQRTADARATTYLELCVLGRRDFQHILTKHPVDRKRVVSSMLSACLIHNEEKGVFCPLKAMVRSVYGAEGATPGDTIASTASQINAAQAASLLAEVVNPEVEDPSIQFGISGRVRQLLVDKRARDLKKSRAAPTMPVVAEPTAQQERLHDDSGLTDFKAQLTALAEQVREVVQSQQELATKMPEVRSVLDQLLVLESRSRARHKSRRHISTNKSARVSDTPSPAVAPADAGSDHSSSSSSSSRSGRRHHGHRHQQVAHRRSKSSHNSTTTTTSKTQLQTPSQHRPALTGPLSSRPAKAHKAAGASRHLSHPAKVLSGSLQQALPLLRRLSSNILSASEQAPPVSTTPFTDELFQQHAGS